MSNIIYDKPLSYLPGQIFLLSPEYVRRNNSPCHPAFSGSKNMTGTDLEWIQHPCDEVVEDFHSINASLRCSVGKWVMLSDQRQQRSLWRDFWQIHSPASQAAVEAKKHWLFELSWVINSIYLFKCYMYIFFFSLIYCLLFLCPVWRECSHNIRLHVFNHVLFHCFGDWW